jgi:DNA-binding transcriptional LysR family regulator
MPLRSDWLPALVAFEAAARHQNFAHAAGELNLTASAVSHHVRKLEDRLGVALFHRHARGVPLTPDGRRLADATGSSLSDLEDAIAGVRAARDDERLVRVATLHSWTCGWLLPRLPEFARTEPQIRLSIETGFALARFDDGGPDLGIRHGDGQWPGLAARLLQRESLFPVASPRMPGIERIAGASDIAKLPLVADLARQGWHDWFRAARVRHAEVQERYRFTDSNAALNAAALGLGIALAREHIVSPFLEAGSLQRLPGPVLEARAGYYLVRPAHRRLRPAAQAFADWLVAAAGAPTMPR